LGAGEQPRIGCSGFRVDDFCTQSITGYTRRMKTAISLPTELFDEIERCAKRLRMTRSGLLAVAARQFVTSHRARGDATEAWNRAIEHGGQPGDDPAARALRRRSKKIIRAGL